MAYSVRPNNDFVLMNSTQGQRSDQLDLHFFTDFTQHASWSNFGVPGDGGTFNMTHLFSTISRSTTDHTDYGITNGHGVISINGGVSIATAFHRIYNEMLLPGVIDPAKAEVITKYEIEMGMEITNNNWASDDVYGYYRLGFVGPSVSNPSDGIYFEFWRNGELDPKTEEYYIDSTPFDNNWMVVYVKDGNAPDRVDTGVPCQINNIYQLYLSVTRKSTDDAVIGWTIINKTTDTKTTGEISVGGTIKYPYQSTDYLTMNWGAYGVGAGINFPGMPRILIDYIGARIRRPVSREILL